MEPSEKTVAKIEAMLRAGKTRIEIASELGLHVGTLRKMIRRLWPEQRYKRFVLSPPKAKPPGRGNPSDLGAPFIPTRRQIAAATAEIDRRLPADRRELPLQPRRVDRVTLMERLKLHHRIVHELLAKIGRAAGGPVAGELLELATWIDGDRGQIIVDLFGTPVEAGGAGEDVEARPGKTAIPVALGFRSGA